MKCLITINGGLGKHVMFTSLLPEIKKKYDEIYIISCYDDVFRCCRLVDAVFTPGVNIYSDLILDPDTRIFSMDPYDNERFIKKQCHLFDAWREILGLNPVNEWDKNITACNTMDVGYEYSDLVKDAKQYAGEHPNVTVVQFSGGQSPLEPMRGPDGQPVQRVDTHHEGIIRNYQRGQHLIDLIKEKFPDTEIIHFGLPNEPGYDGAEKIVKPYLWWHEFAKYIKRAVIIDSSLQHLITPNCKNVNVIWGETQPEHFGYKQNNNIISKNLRNTQPYFRPLGSTNALIKMPTPEEIVEKLK